MTDDTSSTAFDFASKEVLQYLHDRLGFGLWMVTRTQSCDWIVLHAEDHGYGVTNGDVFKWTDSFCSRMVAGDGPRIAPRSADISSYASAPIGQQVPIGAYIGIPLHKADGKLFGTLCAIDPRPQPEKIVEELAQVELMACLLEKILESELRANDEARRAEQAERQAMTDCLTGLFNRRGWDELLASEETRCRRYGHPATVIALDLDNLKTINDTLGHSAGDSLLQETARVLRSNLRETDVVARVGGDEFQVLAIECSQTGSQELIKRLNAVLEEQGISASLGYGFRHATRTLLDACQVADKWMFDCKKLRKQVTGDANR